MGFFSWTTADTGESIANVYSGETVKDVYLLQPNGENPILERAYEGYGEFNGTDAFEWLALKNAGVADRDLGIRLFYEDDEECKFPLKFSFDPDAVYEELPESMPCPNQGYFY